MGHEIDAWIRGRAGASWQDQALGHRGVQLGTFLSRPFLQMSPSSVPTWIHYNLRQP
jgi:hypothetical protein